MTAATRPLRRGSVYAEHTQTPAASRMKRPISCMKLLTYSVPVKGRLTTSARTRNQMRILRLLSSRPLPCGCLAGIYETYAGPIAWIVDARGSNSRIPHTAPELNSIPLAGPTRPPGTQRRLNPRQLRGGRPLPMRSGREGCALCRSCSSTYRYHRSQAVTASPVSPVQRVPRAAPRHRGRTGRSDATRGYFSVDASCRLSVDAPSRPRSPNQSASRWGQVFTARSMDRAPMLKPCLPPESMCASTGAPAAR